jgi:hypothetical protein
MTYKLQIRHLQKVDRRSKLLELETSIRSYPPLFTNTRKYVRAWLIKGNNIELFLFSCLITGIKKERLARWVVKKVKKMQDLSHALNVERTEDGFALNTISDPFAVAVSECAQQLYKTVNALARGETT